GGRHGGRATGRAVRAETGRREAARGAGAAGVPRLRPAGGGTDDPPERAVHRGGGRKPVRRLAALLLLLAGALGILAAALPGTASAQQRAAPRLITDLSQIGRAA